MGSSKKQTVGYWYKILYHAGLSKGPIDAFLEFRGGDKTAWAGELTASGTINIEQPKLWGGEKDQGGIVSDVDVMFGESTQAANAYLLANLGAQVPAWRGLATLVFKGGKYGAMNPYPQKASYKIRKILQGWDGGTAWYAAKAPITMAGTLSIPASSNYKYIVESTPTPDYSAVAYDDSAWAVAPGPFSSGAPPGTYVPTGLSGRTIWIRKTISQADIGVGFGITLTIAHDDGLWLWFNGAPVSVPGAGAVGTSVVTIPASSILASNVIAVKVVDSQPTGTPTGFFASLAITTADPFSAMNPAHVLYFSRTDSDMGREPTANINDASLTAAADTLFAEGFGICTTRDPAQESVEEFEARITKLIDGSFSRDPITGQWYLDLARGDYVLGDLPILTDDDILEFREVPSTLDNAINSVSVSYFDPERKEAITTPPVQARALIQDFGTIHQTIEYPEIPTASLAARVALRELRATATPTRAFDLVCTRKPYAWRPNTYFRLQLPKRGIADMVCIVGEKESGSLKSGAIRLKAAQDIYSMPAFSFVENEPGVDTSPSQVPVPITLQAAFEAPYIELVRTLSRADMDVLPADAGYLLAVAAAPAAGINYTMMVDAGGGYLETGNGDWCPTATVVAASSWLDTAFTLSGGTRLDEVVVGSAALWDNEIVRVDAINPTTGAITLARACADALPALHAAGSRIWFYQDNEANDLTEYTSGESLAVKLLTNTRSQQLDIGSATAMPVGMLGRAVLPYPPAKITLNTAYYPDTITGALALAWAHRDRVLQADQLVDWTAASIGPEAGVTYTLRLYGQAGTLLRTETGLTGNTYNWANEVADSGIIGAGDDPYWNNVVALLHCDGTNGSTTFTDQKSHTFTATGNAQISTAQSKFGGASALFDGTGDLVSSADHADWALGAGDWTIECWVRPASTAAQCVILHKRASSAVYGPFGIYMDAGGKAGFLISVDGSTWGVNILTGTGIFVAGTWAHVAFCRSGNNYYAFVNGTSAGTASLAGALFANTAPLCIGANGDASVSFNGNIDDVRITKGAARYTAAFTPPAAAFPNTGGTGINGQVRVQLESVRAALTSGQRHDWTVNRTDPWWADVVALLRMDGTNGSTTFTDQKGHTFTATGNAQIGTAQSQFGGASALFDGTGDLVSSADHADWNLGGGDWTIECWVRPASTAAQCVILHKRASNAAYGPFGIYMDAGGKAGFLLSTSGSAWAVNVLSAGVVFAVGTWAHVAMCRQAGTVYCWVNGVSAGSAAISGTLMVNTQPLCLGANADASVSFNGNLDAVRITKAHARYVVAFTPLNKAYPEG